MTITQLQQNPRDRKKMLGLLLAAVFCFFLTSLFRGNIPMTATLLAIVAGCLCYARILLKTVEEDEDKEK